MRDGQNHDFATPKIKYDAPVSNPQAHCGVPFVRLTTRVFRDPAPDGYRDARDFGPADRLTPLVAPEAFAVRLDELDLS